MVNSERPLRVLWFANTPGLSQHHLNKTSGGGWISSLQHGVESLPDVKLGFVFYSEDQIEPFAVGNTRYYPVRKIGHSKKARLLNRVTSKTEYKENLPNFLRIIKDFQPDIIHVHGTEFSFGLIVKHVHDIPIVVSIQGNLTVYEKKYFSGINMPAFIQQLKAGYPFFKADFAIWKKRSKIEQEILAGTKYVFGRTDWDKRISLVMAPKARYFHVDEVMREPFYQIKWEPRSNNTPVFLTTCSASLYKGFETIIDTARALKDIRFPFTWLVAGLKEEDALVKLVKKIRNEENLEELNIRLMGTLSADDLVKNLLQADIYVQVSHIENSPNSLCEAMLAGIPIIASFAGGTSSLLQDRIHGVLVQNGDPYALAGGLIEITQDPENFVRMARTAYQAAHARHDAHTVVQQLMTAYTDIIREHHAQHNSNAPLPQPISINK